MKEKCIKSSYFATTYKYDYTHLNDDNEHEW